MRTDYYSVLQVERSASLGEIRKAFRQLVLTHHPDRNGNNPQSAESTILLYEAYATLSNSAKRAEYDKQLDASPNRNSKRKTVTMQRTDPAAPEAIRCARCSRCDDTLRHSEFFMVVSLISFAKQSVEQPGVYCSGCRSALGTKWLAMSMLCGWWSFPGLIWTPKAMVRNIAGGLRRGHSQRALLRQLASRLIWQKQFSDAYRVVRRLSFLDPEFPKLQELTAKVQEGRRKPQTRSSFALHPRRLPTAFYALPIALLPALSVYVSVFAANELRTNKQFNYLTSPIAKFFGASGQPNFRSDSDTIVDGHPDTEGQGMPSGINSSGSLAGSFSGSGKAGSDSIFSNHSKNAWTAIDAAAHSQTQKHPELDDQQATQSYFQPADIPDLPSASAVEHHIVVAKRKPIRPTPHAAPEEIAAQPLHLPAAKPARVPKVPVAKVPVAPPDVTDAPPADPNDVVVVDPPSYDDTESTGIIERKPSASTSPVTSQPDAHALAKH